jgi:hypothetical protein
VGRGANVLVAAGKGLSRRDGPAGWPGNGGSELRAVHGTGREVAGASGAGGEGALARGWGKVEGGRFVPATFLLSTFWTAPLTFF